MLSNEQANEIISTVIRKRLNAYCSCCQQAFSLSRAGLFVGNDYTPEAADMIARRQQEIVDRKAYLRERKGKVAVESEELAASVNLGCVVERLAPSMGAFPFQANDCRSLFAPIDYVVFQGLTRTSRVEQISFVDIKTGKARLSQQQQVIKNLVNTGKVRWATYGLELGR